MEYNEIVALKYAQHFCKVANDRLKSKNIFCNFSDCFMKIYGQIQIFYDFNGKTYYFGYIDIKQLELLVISQFRHFDLAKDNINLIYDCLLTDINYIPSITNEQGC
jgi:hypothetical protein